MPGLLALLLQSCRCGMAVHECAMHIIYGMFMSAAVRTTRPVLCAAAEHLAKASYRACMSYRMALGWS